MLGSGILVFLCMYTHTYTLPKSFPAECRRDPGVCNKPSRNTAYKSNLEETQYASYVLPMPKTSHVRNIAH